MTEKCFYCKRSVINRNESAEPSQKIADTRSPDHYYPKKDPRYDINHVVMSCIQCNFTKSCGDPDEFMEALKKAELPKWGVRGATRYWYRKTGYDQHKYR